MVGGKESWMLESTDVGGQFVAQVLVELGKMWRIAAS